MDTLTGGSVKRPTRRRSHRPIWPANPLSSTSLSSHVIVLRGGFST